MPPAVAELHRFTHGRHRRADKTHGITREQQDALALRSHQRAAQARQSGVLAQEVMPAFVPPWKAPIEQDNNIRFNASAADYAKLRPAFDRRHGSVTAATRR